MPASIELESPAKLGRAFPSNNLSISCGQFKIVRNQLRLLFPRSCKVRIAALVHVSKVEQNVPRISQSRDFAKQARPRAFDLISAATLSRLSPTIINKTQPRSDSILDSFLRRSLRRYFVTMTTPPKASKRKLDHTAPISPPPLRRKLQSNTTRAYSWSRKSK